MADEKTKTDETQEEKSESKSELKRRQDDDKFREGNKSDKRLDAVDQLLEEWEAMKKHVNFSFKKGELSEPPKPSDKPEDKPEDKDETEPGFLESHTSMWGL